MLQENPSLVISRSGPINNTVRRTRVRCVLHALMSNGIFNKPFSLKSPKIRPMCVCFFTAASVGRNEF